MKLILLLPPLGAVLILVALIAATMIAEAPL